MKKSITASIVCYHNNKTELERAIRSFLHTALDVKLYLVDNSSEESIRHLVTDERIEYIFNNANLGFGKAHNIAIQKAIQESQYHLILNPDVYFDSGVLENMMAYAEKHPDVGLMMPKVLYDDGSIQYLCKLLPSPFNLIFRRFLPMIGPLKKINDTFELKMFDYNKIANIPYLSGCFMFVPTGVFKEIGLFDEQYFMYLEDVDLSRRIHVKYKTLFYPEVTIYHTFHKDSYKSKKLLMFHIQSAFIYFNKWGWIFDSFRSKANAETLKQFN